jgi:hypothetical protein
MNLRRRRRLWMRRSRRMTMRRRRRRKRIHLKKLNKNYLSYLKMKS